MPTRQSKCPWCGVAGRLYADSACLSCSALTPLERRERRDARLSARLVCRICGIKKGIGKNRRLCLACDALPTDLQDAVRAYREAGSNASQIEAFVAVCKRRKQARRRRRKLRRAAGASGAGGRRLCLRCKVGEPAPQRRLCGPCRIKSLKQQWKRLGSRRADPYRIRFVQGGAPGLGKRA